MNASEDQAPWRPSRAAQAIQWWARFTLRYVIGGGGLIYEVLIDHLRNPTALVVFGGLATLQDVIGFRAEVKAQEKAVAQSAQREEQGEP